MDFRIELHAHTSETSNCGKLPGSQMAQGYAVAGYDTLVITDHISADRFATGFRRPEERAELFLAGYRAAKAEGEKWGLNVLLGAEARLVSGDEDFLIFGLEEADIAPLMLFLDARPDIYALHARVHEWDALLVQAHPYRPGQQPAPADALDGMEVYNGSQRHDSRNELALAYAEENGLLMTSGSDAHQFMDVGRGGLLSDVEITSSRALADFLRRDKRPRRIETYGGFLADRQARG